MHSLLTYILQLCSCKNLLFSNNKLICSFVCFFVQFSASVELDTQKGYLISSLKYSEQQWIAKKKLLQSILVLWSLYEIIHICTAVVDESEIWSSQWIFQFKQLERRSLKKIRASTGFEPVTSAIPVRCSTNWAMKPHIGSEVNLLSSYLPVQWNDVKFYMK